MEVDENVEYKELLDAYVAVVGPIAKFVTILEVGLYLLDLIFLSFRESSIQPCR